MAPTDVPDPGDIPDMEIPERDSYRPVPPASAHRAPWLDRKGWRVGERVLAPWEPEFLYAGTITEVDGMRALVEFDDGDAGWVGLAQLQEVVLKAGKEVLSRRRMGPVFAPGTIQEVRGEQVLVAFRDTDEREWVTVAALRIPCLDVGPGATPTRVESHLAFQQHLEVGDRVWAPWANAALFAGTIARLSDDEAYIQYDDGDRGWARRADLAPLMIVAGMRVMGRWRMGAQFYPGTIAEVDGDRVHIAYDDGDREWTKPAALAIPLSAAGTGGQRASLWRHSAIWNWGLPIAIGLALVLLRISCR